MPARVTKRAKSQSTSSPKSKKGKASQNTPLHSNLTNQDSTEKGKATGLDTSHYPFSIPDDILLEISRHLGTHGLVACSSTCKRWKQIIESDSSLWFRNVELQGKLPQMYRQWEHIREQMEDDTIIDFLEINHKEDYSGDEDLDDETIDQLWIHGVLATMPFNTLREIRYTGEHKILDVEFWNAIEACASLRLLKIKSLSQSTPILKFRGHNLMDSEYAQAISRCRLEHLELDLDNATKLDHLNFSGMKKLILHVVYPGRVIRDYIASAARTLEEIQICAVGNKVERDFGWSKIEGKCNHEHHCPFGNKDGGKNIHHEWSLESRGDGNIVMPRLRKFRAFGHSTRANIADENQEIYVEGSTKVTYSIVAPNLEMMLFEGFLGWDKTLFKSCSRNLKVVRFEIHALNVLSIYKAISQLTACEELTLMTQFPVVSLGSDGDIKHPFGGDYSTLAATPAKALSNLKELYIIDDYYISGQDLIRFVEYKKASAKRTPLERLHIAGCRLVEAKDVERLKELIPNVTYK